MRTVPGRLHNAYPGSLLFSRDAGQDRAMIPLIERRHQPGEGFSLSRRSGFSSVVTSLSAASGSTARPSRVRPIQRTSVDGPIPRSMVISRCVRPPVCAKWPASSNLFLNRRCRATEFPMAHRELSIFRCKSRWHRLSKDYEAPPENS